METSTIAIVVSAAAVLFTVGDRLVGGSWKLSGKLAAMEKGLRAAITESKEEIEQRQDTMKKEFGETAAALREKVREVELFVRDKYIEKNDFIIQMQHHNEMISMNFTNITARLDRMEKKLDSKT